MSIIVNSVPLPFIGLNGDDKAVIVLSGKEAIQLPLKWDGKWTKLNENFSHYVLCTTCTLARRERLCFRELPAPIYISSRMFNNIKIGTFGHVGNKCIIFISEKKTIGLYLSEHDSSRSENALFNVDSECNFRETEEFWRLT